METFDHDGESVRALRIPVYITLRGWQDRDMGLRLRLAATAAASDLFDLLEQGLTEVRVRSFVPGLEFVLPIGKTHMLRPFFDLGVGSNSVADDLDVLAAIGLRTEFIFPRGNFVYGLEPGFQFSTNASGVGQDTNVLSPFIQLTARRLLGFRMAGHIPDVGIYFDGGYNFQALELASVTATDDNMATQFEVGLGFGFTHRRPRVGPFAVPRLRVGYRFGDLEGFRIRVGGDWLRELPDPTD